VKRIIFEKRNIRNGLQQSGGSLAGDRDRLEIAVTVNRILRVDPHLACVAMAARHEIQCSHQ
jgi:hypothetical protein